MDTFDTTSQAFYYYYDDKDELLAEVLDRFLARAERRLRWLDDHPLPPWAKLRLILAEHVATVTSEPAMAAVAFQELQRAPASVRGTAHARMAAYTKRLQEICQAGMDAGELARGDASTAISAVLGMCNNTYRWFRPSRSQGPEELGQTIAEMAMRALGRVDHEDDELLSSLERLQDPPAPKRRRCPRS